MDEEHRSAAQHAAELTRLRRQLATLEAVNQRQQVISRVRQEVWRMRRSMDMENVLTAVWEGLRALGISFSHCSINRIDADLAPPLITVYNINPQKQWRKRQYQDHPFPPLMRIWKTGEPNYRADLHQEDPFGERPMLKVPLRSILDVPFRQGTMAISSENPHAFSTADVEAVREIGQVLSEGFQRMEDLGQLENRNEELEKELAERRQVEASLQREHDLAQNYLDVAEVMLIVLDRTGEIVLINPKGCRILGYTREELIGQNWFTRCLPEGARNDVREVFSQLISGELELIEYFENPVLTKSREERLIAWHNALLRDSHGAFTGILSSGHDITDQRRAEEVLQASEERFRTLVETPSDLIVMHLTPEGRYLYVSPQIEALTGYAPEDFYADQYTGHRITHPEDLAASDQAFQRIVAGAPRERLDFRWKHRGGAYHWGLETIVPIYDPAGQLETVQVVIQDTTDRKQLEQEVVRTQRLRAVGELAAGVSHNLNNLLTGVLRPAQLLQLLTRDPELLQEVEVIINAGQRARDLVRDLHLSVRGAERGALQAVAVDRIVEEALRGTRPRWKDEPEASGAAIEVITRIEDVPPILGTPSQLRDILTNLIFNAVDAMPRGGTVTIAARPLGTFVRLTFADTGIGMDEETQKRIFEPFFTTKAEVGTGLGLSTVYGTVSRWGGRIEVDSAPHSGTTFTIDLPIWRDAEKQEKEQTSPAPSRSLSVLVIDDDPTICSVLSHWLGKRHQVKTVQDGRQAVERFAPEKYEVALIDLGISGMPGDRIARELRRLDPLLVAVLITGWKLDTDDPRWTAFDLHLQKPFDDLTQVDQALSRAIELRDERVKAQE